jgi:PAS domain S-box-containing protein
MRKRKVSPRRALRRGSAPRPAAKRKPPRRPVDHVYAPLPALQLIYDTAPVGLAFLSPDCRYLQINQRLTEICGISVAEHIGRTVRETVPQVAEQVEQIVAAIMRTGAPITDVEVRGQRTDRRNVDHVWITHWHPLKGPRGRIVGVNVVAEDVTARKRAEDELVKNEKALRELAETLEHRVETETRERLQIWNVSQDLLVVGDLDGRILSANPAWTATLGWPQAELVGGRPSGCCIPTIAQRRRPSRSISRPGARPRISRAGCVTRTGRIAGCRGLRCRIATASMRPGATSPGSSRPSRTCEKCGASSPRSAGAPWWRR